MMLPVASGIDEIEVAFNEPAQLVLKLVAVVILFSVALDVRVDDLRRIARRPWAVLLGVAAQFAALPLATIVIVRVLDVRGSIALGMILVACCPAGKISNLLTLRSHGDTALSVSLTLVSNLVSLGTLAFAFPLWVALDPRADALLTQIDVPIQDVLVEVVLIVGLPLAVGVLVGARRPRLASRLHLPLSRIGLYVLLLLVAASLVANAEMLRHHLAAVFLLVMLHDAVAFALGYLVARGAGLAEPGRRALTFEVGVRNAGLALVLVFEFFGGLGGMALVVAWWSVWDIVVGLAVARWWRSRPVAEREPAGVARELG